MKRSSTMTAKKSTRSRDVTRAVSKATFIRQLRRLADRLERGGRFSVAVGKERVTLPSDVEFGIEHEREGAAEELEFQVRWSRR